MSFFSPLFLKIGIVFDISHWLGIAVDSVKLTKLNYYFILFYFLIGVTSSLFKKETCLRGRAAVWPRGRVAEINFCCFVCWVFTFIANLVEVFIGVS